MAINCKYYLNHNNNYNLSKFPLLITTCYLEAFGTCQWQVVMINEILFSFHLLFQCNGLEE